MFNINVDCTYERKTHRIMSIEIGVLTLNRDRYVCVC